MNQYQTFDPRAELNGRTASSLINNILHDNLAAILQKRQLTDIDPERWYPVQNILDVFNDLLEAEGGSASTTFVSVGMGAGELGYQALPPEMKEAPLEMFLANFNRIWQTRHRNDENCFVAYEKLSDTHFIMRAKMPYPDDVIYGVFYAYCRHLCPKGKRCILSYDNQSPTREKGGEETIIHIHVKN